MSDSGRNERAFPANDLDRDFTFFTDFGGKGGGPGCPEPLGVDRNVIAFDLNPFIVYNKLAVLEVALSFGSLVYTDAGPGSEGFFTCDHTTGERVPIHVAFSSNPNLSASEILAQDNRIPTTWESNDEPLEFTYRDRNDDGSLGFIPQPTDPSFDGNAYLTLYWGSPDYVTVSKGTQGWLPGSGNFDGTEIIKEDYNERI